MKCNTSYDMQIGKLFDLQKFNKNSRLVQLITDVEERYCKELSDEDLCMVHAAGEPDILKGEPKQGMDVI